LKAARSFLLVDEVAVAHAPRGDRVGDAVDHLSHRPLALVGAERAAEVLLGDDVRGVLRPRDGKLDVGLVERVGAVLEVRDARLAPLPLERVVGMHPRLGEVPTDPDPDVLRRDRHCVLLLLVSPARATPSLPRRRIDQPLDVVVRWVPVARCGAYYNTGIPRVSMGNISNISNDPARRGA